VIVVDGSALVVAVTERSVDALAARAALADGAIAPHLIDAEVGQALRAMVRRGELDDDAARRALVTGQLLVDDRVPHHPFTHRAWELRDNLTFYDALYVAIAEARGLTLLTADARLAASPGPRCAFEVV
jgi:predicted nucleic acid-binding protein